ncbi:MAG: sulfatase [Lentisphaeraceae bacterium]|nr:sulfatase [Lentisphaeraceae bacterium]
MIKSMCMLIFLSVFLSLNAETRPNILWFVVDDMSANFSCYGEKLIQTPNVDKLAKEGTLFTRAYATSPVCSTFRSALITGMYQTSIGAHHHRSGRSKLNPVILPEGVEPVPVLFQKAGYWTCMGSGLPGYDKSGNKGKNGLGKTDYNFTWNKSMYNSPDWAGRKEGQPFFMQVQLHGGKIRGAGTSQYAKTEKRAQKLFGESTKKDSIVLPPYYPRDEVMLRDWATYLDTVKITDWHVGQVMERLKKENLIENTIVIFFTDHGISHARGKQFLYDEGTHIPLVISGQGIDKNKVRTDMVEHIDIAALSLKLAGIEIPEKMEGKDILSDTYKSREAVFGARDRCGEAADRIRSVRTDKFLYVKNFYPQRPFLMPSNYKDSKLILKKLRALHKEGKLNTLAEKLLFSPTRPAEELYLYEQDKWQIKNLADDPKYKEELEKHRAILNDWIERTDDPGPESLEVYKIETEDQLNGKLKGPYYENSLLYMKWMKEGK